MSPQDHQEHLDEHEGKVNYYCDQCEFSHARHKKLVAHLLSDHGISISESPSKRPLSARAQRKLDAKGLAMVCTYCGAVHKTTLGLSDHIKRVHERTETFQCDQCPKLFYLKKDLVYHMKDSHPTEWFQCPKCVLKFSGRNRLRDHMKSHEEPRYQCRFCPKKLRKHWNLVNHERLHTGDKPYQ